MEVFRRRDVTRLVDLKADSIFREAEGAVAGKTRQGLEGRGPSLAEKGNSGESDGSFQ